MHHVSIPKRISHVWITIKSSDIPSKWNPAIQSIKDYLPRWERHTFRENDIEKLIIKIKPDFIDIYRSFQYGIQRADAARAFILYEYGGVYMDFDYEIISEDFEKLFCGSQDEDNLFLVPSGNVQSYFTNSFMASTKGHPFWLDYIERMTKPNPWFIMGKHFVVQNSTGPLALTDVARETRYNITVLPSKKITPCSVCNSDCIIEGAYLKQLEGSSWIGFDTEVYIVLMCNHKTIILWVIIVAFAIVIAFLFWLFYLILIK